MKTKMEMMVGYLAGRQDETAGSIRRELEDPSSEASRWLEAVRARSREIFGPGSPEGLDSVATRPGRLPEEPRLIAPRPIRNRPTAPAPRVPERRPSRTLWGASAAALMLLAAGAAWRAQDDRLRRLETILVRREARWGDRLKHLEETLTKREAPPQKQAPSPKAPSSGDVRPSTPLDRPTRLALNRIEGKLGELERRLGESRTSEDLADQRVAQLRRDLDQLKQEVQTSSRAGRQEMQDLSRAVGELLLLVRRLATHPQGQEPMQIPVPPQGQDMGFGRGPAIRLGPGQIPNQGQMPGQEHDHIDPGWGNRNWRPQGFPGRHTGPGMQPPKGPG